MSTAPTPVEIFHRAAREGQRRLDQSLLELTATGFIAGFTIVFGIVALGIVDSMLQPYGRGVAKIAGALAFAIGLVLLVVQRAELFSENFFDPLAAAFERRRSHLTGRIARLWSLTFAINVLGGGLFAWLVTVEGVLPSGARDSLATVAEEIASRSDLAAFVSAIVGGALVALLSYSLLGTDSVAARIVMAYFVGFLLALGPFDHVIVTGLHVATGMLSGAAIDAGRLLAIVAIATLGNLVGGVGLVTLSHVAQAKGANG
jgi:formate/nitrite transporter FocA (FNT family)